MYKKFVKPSQGQLLELLNLDRVYLSGHQNYIYDQDQIKILDMTGSYGANNLGHGNEIRNKAANYLMENSLSFTQGAIRKESAELAEIINSELNSEGHNGEWITQFSNTGTEAVEVSIKIAKKHYQEKVSKLRLELNEQFNKAYKVINDKNDSLENLANVKAENEKILSQSPKSVAIENSFHGKTSASLQLTYNESLKDGILCDLEKSSTIYVKRNNKVDLVLKVESAKTYINMPQITNGNVEFKKVAFYPISAFILEPIQGEAGIFELEKEFLAIIQENSKRIDSLLIFDEIQSGVYRTGKLASSTHASITPDIFTFAKGLSAGFAKIATTVINSNIFPEGFDNIQSSTFAEDDMSSFVAKEVLKECKIAYEQNNTNIEELKSQLNELVLKYPTVFSQVRGKGLMLAIEIAQELRTKFYEFKYFADCNMLGHLLSSALLNNEQIRIAPTLSNQSTLRVQPSLRVNSWEISKLVQGLENMAKHILLESSEYFFAHILGEIEVGSFGKIESPVAKQITAEYKDAAVFLNHPIENNDVRKILPVLEHTPDEVLEEIMMQTFNLQSFSPYFAERVEGENSREIDIVMLSIPLTSKILFKKFRSKQRHKVVLKIQEGIDKAKALGASTVGLGQFTSIVSKNGMYLDNKGLNLTTGNSFTAKLAYEAGLNAQETNQKVIGLVGYGGNIISTIAQMALADAEKVVLFHRGKDLYGNKIRNSFEELIKYVIRAKVSSPLIDKIRKRVMDSIGNISESLESFSDLIEISNDLQDLSKCDVIYTGTNSTRPIITEDLLKKNTTIIDLAVPGDIDPKLIKESSIKVIKGGIARFPTNNDRDIKINIPSFPLKTNESFACMAETFSIGLSSKKGKLNIGPISIDDIYEISEVAQDAGFKLAGTKTESSF